MRAPPDETAQGLIADWQALFMLPRSIWLPILAMSFIAFGTVLFNESSVKRIRADGDEMAALMTTQKDLLELRTGLADAETGQRGYLLSRNPKFLVPYNDSIERLTVIAARLRAEIGDDQQLLAILQQLDLVRGRKVAELRATVLLAQQGQTDNALLIVRSGEGRVAMDEFRFQAQLLLKELEQRVDGLRASTTQHVQWSRIAFAALGMLTLALLVVAVRLLVKDFWRLESARQEQVSERQRLEQVVEERTAELSELTTYLQSMAEQEKAELARNLHDELGGILTAAKMDLAWLQGRASAAEPGAAAKLDALAAGIDDAMHVKSRVVENLRPALLDHFGLPAALQSYFDETCQQAGLRCDSRIVENVEPVPREMAIALFRIGQESLTNIIRHASASRVEVSFRSEAGSYLMVIADDGIGIGADRVSGAASHGLAGMRHRVASLDGRFAITANQPRGTRIEVSVPRPHGA